MEGTYYEDAVYFSWKACMKQLKEQELLTPPEGVGINNFDLANASFDTEFSVHDDSDDYMISKFADMKPGELQVIRVQDCGTHNIGIKEVEVTNNVILPKGGAEVTERTVFDDEGASYGNMALEDVQKKMLEEKFTKAYFVCEPGKAVKLQPSPVPSGSVMCLNLPISKYAVFGRL